MEERNKRNESMRRRSSRRKRRTSAATGNIDKALALFQNKFALVVVVVVVLIALVLGLSFCGKDDEGKTTTDSGEVIVGTTEAPGVDPSTYELQKNAIPQLNELVNTYFSAMKNADAQGYMNIVAGDELTQEKLEKKGEFIEDYQNVECYTKPGMVEGTYVAFVYYEIKFHNIDTLAPSMIRLYVCTNEDGSMYINAGELDAELTGYMNVISNDEDLRLLEDETNRKLADACAADDKLNALYDLLKQGTVPETEPETTEEPETDISEMVFEERNEKVITTTSVRIRSTPTTETDDNILGKVEAGEELKRVGYNANWSKIIYKGEEAYISSEYVITK
ncbi:MAG: SH3 domain-containing protein [Lachnospiraceae bacterium]|nr:SH3 domain-containing protein [Lachnospiraceae bacterium]